MSLRAPLGALLGGAARLRAALYRREILKQARLAGPVISVGNLSMGGSGKTPVVAWLARTLAAEGRPVAILSRGYGGSFRGRCLVVSDGTTVLADAATAGDEPVMLARALTGVVVAVGPRRDVVGREVEERFGPRVHLLDDGFQHLRLARALDIVCVTAGDLADHPLPAGFLRESRAALRRAGVVLLSRDGASATALSELAERLGASRTFLTSRRPLGFFTADRRPMAPPSRAYLLSGVGRPERFAADVAAAGCTIAGHARFSDHHRYTPRELDAVWKGAVDAGAHAVVTTAKDLVRLPDAARGLPLVVFEIETAIEREDELRARVRAVAAAGPA